MSRENRNYPLDIVKKIKLIANYLDFTQLKHPIEHRLLSKELLELDDLASKIVELVDFEEERKKDYRTEEGEIQKNEMIANKKEYEERKKLKSDLKGVFPLIMTYIYEREDSCELRIETSLCGKNENVSNVKQILKDALIEHFEDLIERKENFMFDPTFYKPKVD